MIYLQHNAVANHLFLWTRACFFCSSDLISYKAHDIVAKRAPTYTTPSNMQGHMGRQLLYIFIHVEGELHLLAVLPRSLQGDLPVEGFPIGVGVVMGVEGFPIGTSEGL